MATDNSFVPETCGFARARCTDRKARQWAVKASTIDALEYEFLASMAMASASMHELSAVPGNPPADSCGITSIHVPHSLVEAA